jgi:hypothetical protein
MMIRQSFNTLRSLSPNCREAARLMSQVSGRNLSRPERIGLQVHVLICRSCRAYRHSIRILAQLMRIATRTSYPVETIALPQAAKDRILRELKSRL